MAMQVRYLLYHLTVMVPSISALQQVIPPRSNPFPALARTITLTIYLKFLLVADHFQIIYWQSNKYLLTNCSYLILRSKRVIWFVLEVKVYYSIALSLDVFFLIAENCLVDFIKYQLNIIAKISQRKLTTYIILDYLGKMDLCLQILDFGFFDQKQDCTRATYSFNIQMYLSKNSSSSFYQQYLMIYLSYTLAILSIVHGSSLLFIQQTREVSQPNQSKKRGIGCNQKYNSSNHVIRITTQFFITLHYYYNQQSNHHSANIYYQFIKYFILPSNHYISSSLFRLLFLERIVIDELQLHFHQTTQSLPLTFLLQHLNYQYFEIVKDYLAMGEYLVNLIIAVQRSFRYQFVLVLQFCTCLRWEASLD